VPRPVSNVSSPRVLSVPQPGTTARDSTSDLVPIQMVYVEKGEPRTLHAVHLVQDFK